MEYTGGVTCARSTNGQEVNIDTISRGSVPDQHVNSKNLFMSV